MVENYTITLTDFQEGLCPSAIVFAENLQTVLNISEEDAHTIVNNLPHNISENLSKSDALKLANILEAFGAVVILSDQTDNNVFSADSTLSLEPSDEEDQMMLFEIEDIETESSGIDNLNLNNLDSLIFEEHNSTPDQTKIQEDEQEELLFSDSSVDLISFDLLEEDKPIVEIEEEVEKITTPSIEDAPLEPILTTISLASDTDEDELKFTQAKIDLPVKPSKPDILSNHLAEPIDSTNKAKNTETKPGIAQPEPINTKMAVQEISIQSTPFLEKKRQLSTFGYKYPGQTMLALLAIFTLVYFYNSNPHQDSALSIDINPELVKSLLQSENSSKANESIELTQKYLNFEGEIKSDTIQGVAKLNKANLKIETLKIKLDALTDKLTTANEFITNTFYPHLHSLEIQIRDVEGVKEENYSKFQGSARVFYMYKNKPAKGIIEISVSLKDDDTELLVTHSGISMSNDPLSSTPKLTIENGETTFMPFQVSIPLKSYILKVPKRQILPTIDETKGPKKDKKASKKKKKSKN